MKNELDNQKLIFKFQKCGKYLSQSLNESTFYFNNIESFNDPFEFSFSIETWHSNSDGIDHFYDKVFPETALKEFNYEKRIEIALERKNFPQRDMLLLTDIENSLRSVLSDFYGVVCFSRSYKNVLMWSHYADLGKGVAQIFDSENLFTPNNSGYPKLLNVDYQDKAPKTSVKLDKSKFHFNGDSIIGTKRINWSTKKKLGQYNL